MLEKRERVRDRKTQKKCEIGRQRKSERERMIDCGGVREREKERRIRERERKRVFAEDFSADTVSDDLHIGAFG